MVCRGERLVLKKLFVCRGPTGQDGLLNLNLWGRRERVVAARHPPQATARLASLSDIFPV